MVSKRWGWAIIVLMALSLVFSACGGSTGSGATGGKVTIKLYFHGGAGPERDALNASLKIFQAQYPNIIVDAVQLSGGSYNDQVHTATLAHNLPCLLDFDGPNLYNYTWSGYLIPLDKYVSASMKADFLPSIIQQGTYGGHLYSLGQFDSGLSFYGNKKYLEAAQVDGASRLRMYWQLIVPLSRPVFATVAILQFLAHFGDFLWPLMVTTGDTYRPLMVGMQALFGQNPIIWGPIMAYASMATLPILLVFLLFQKWFIQSVASIGVKG